MSIDWQVQTFDTLPSTMDVAHELARSHNPEGVVIVAKEQSDGRGRRDSKWFGPLGNLYFSSILRPPGLSRDVGQHSFILAVALAATVKKRIQENCRYQHKWPNDGLLNGKKFAGILLETSLAPEGRVDYLIAGVGINIASAPDDKIAFNNLSKEQLSSEEFLEFYLENLAHYLEIYREQGFSPIREAWLEDAKGLHEDITVRLPQDTLKGVFNGLDDNGALILGSADGQKLIHAGDVFFGKEI